MPDPRVLVLNCGSSSLKFAVMDPQSGEPVLSGLAECFGLQEARVSWKSASEKHESPLPHSAAHSEAVEFIIEQLLRTDPTLEQSLVAIGHRVVHGGEQFSRSVRIDQQVLDAIEQCASLAPLHNPANLLGIRAAIQAFPQLPQVAVFDTAFHQTMPPRAYLYALPYSLYREHGLRRYGMHGTSHQFVSRRAAELLGVAPAELNVISAHLGNGASVTAVRGGVSVDTSMGLTPLEGLVMGTRSGDLDPGLIFHLVDNLQYTVGGVNRLLNKESGLLGISELSNDCRTLEEAAENGDDNARLALEIFCYRLAKYIAAYTVPLERLDAVIFTGGIGENSQTIRALTLSHLKALGFRVDATRNAAARFGQAGVITTDNSPVAIVIPTNEEWVIAADAAALAAREAN
ncbi:acetate kinase [Biformimicrobium ophioploci]|uniref:Acetate kinase n=1 Tax=Biformimicrobium ophioploci TaxID=3036711 RepID=A0ABQ6LZZ6_9GAMM|nr:acetate kinase [Microbulbifer sp. NKW57]GMG87647.1 acetate kinase [Microbulbifer sp. NKW57]